MASTHVPTRPVAIVEDEDSDFSIEEGSNANRVAKYSYEALPRDLELHDGPATLNQESVKRGTNYFRLLELQPGDYKSLLKCNLTTYNLEFPDFPAYQALSYTWNDSKSDLLVVGGKRVAFSDDVREKYDIRHPLWCDGKRLLISTNLTLAPSSPSSAKSFIASPLSSSSSPSQSRTRVALW